MEMMDESRNNATRFHTLFGEYCLIHSIFVILNLYVTGFSEGYSQYGFFARIIVYSVIVFFIDFLLKMITPMKPTLHTAYSMLTGCCECITVISLLFPASPDLNFFAAGTLLGAVTGLVSIYCSTPKALSFYYRFDLSELLSWMIYGLITGMLLSFLLCNDKASANNEVISLLCFGLSGIGAGLTYIILSFIQKWQDRIYGKEFEEERDKINKEQDLYDEKFARSTAEKHERERAEKEARERERRERERNERAGKDHGHYYRSSSSNGSSRNYKGSWNDPASSYFKGCSNKAELKRRYHQLCKKLHPDNPGGNTDSFRRMKSEYEDLYRKMAG